MCVNSVLNVSIISIKLSVFYRYSVHLSNKKKKRWRVFPEFSQCLYRSSEKKKFVLCGYYVLIKREIAVGLIPSVKTPPSPQKKLGRESLFPNIQGRPYCFSRDGYIHSKQQIRNNMISFCDSHFFGHLIDKRNECSISRTNF